MENHELTVGSVIQETYDSSTRPGPHHGGSAADFMMFNKSNDVDPDDVE